MASVVLLSECCDGGGDGVGGGGRAEVPGTGTGTTDTRSVDALMSSADLSLVQNVQKDQSTLRGKMRLFEIQNKTKFPFADTIAVYRYRTWVNDYHFDKCKSSAGCCTLWEVRNWGRRRRRRRERQEATHDPGSAGSHYRYRNIVLATINLQPVPTPTPTPAVSTTCCLNAHASHGRYGQSCEALRAITWTRCRGGEGGVVGAGRRGAW
ncbi:hypothetical protein E2C01_028339 [Portunus trituberculatus]|uniref:Uncharacterized protein n=1 Tax=Portunus trituberculatus TaxID=210409 RepID=A0A5B7ENW5_PORTR|nr:hypothetical protein [Portunus trituberculatus]